MSRSRDGSDLHPRVSFLRSKSDGTRDERGEDRVTSEAKSEPGPVQAVESSATYDGRGGWTHTGNDGGDGLRMRSYSDNNQALSPRKYSDPGDARRRWLDTHNDPRDDDINHSDLSRSYQLDLERSMSTTRPGSQLSSSRRQLHIRPRPRITGAGGSFYLIEAADDNDFNIVEEAENELEARKMINNHMFGLRIWKSPVSTRDKDDAEFLKDDTRPAAAIVSTLRFSNIVYTVLIGWWLALLYGIIGCFMFLSVMGYDYGHLCLSLAKYFIWPFGKYVHRRNFSKPKNKSRSFGLRPISRSSATTGDNLAFSSKEVSTGEDQQPGLSQVVVEAPSIQHPTRGNSPGAEGSEISSLSKDSITVTVVDMSSSQERQPLRSGTNYTHWKKPGTYLWLMLGVPVLLVIHLTTFCVTWILIVTIPIARINLNTMTKVLLAAPTDIHIDSSPATTPRAGKGHSEVVACTHHSFNVSYFKYKVDGVNVVLVNLLGFVVISIIVGFVDHDNQLISPIAKCVMGMLAILPVTYYIGMAITCISAQSSFAVGAIMNATFGSIVEVILYIIMLKEGMDSGQTCYMELVKSTLTGSILCCILFVPGISMIVGGIKYRRQKFNPRSANISSSLLMVAVIGVFAPTIFSKMYGNLTCEVCQTWQNLNSTTGNDTGFLCSGCRTVTDAPYDDQSLFNGHIMPLFYCCALILPLSYIIGLIFSMKTHTKEIFEEFEELQKAEGAGGHGSSAQWSNLKSAIILCLSVTAISLCSDLIAGNIAPLLNVGGISEYFVGVTLLSIVSMLPELVNGVLFALQNNVNLGIEIGSAAAIQVCMVQLPIIVLADLIYPLGFGAIFHDIHVYAVLFAVIIINYVFMDGKSDYFQGSIVVFIYMLLMAMYFFTVTPHTAVCGKRGGQ